MGQTSTSANNLSYKISDEESRALYNWLSVPRFVVVITSATVIALFWYLRLITFDPFPVIFILLPAEVIISVSLYLLMRSGRWSRQVLQANLVVDASAIAVGLFLTGGAKSPFLPFFFLVVISAGMVSTLMVAIIGAFCISTYVFFFVSPRAADFSAIEISALVVFLTSIVIAAFQSRYYSFRIRERDAALGKIKDEFLYRTIHDLRSPLNNVRLVLDLFGSPANGAYAIPEKQFKPMYSTVMRMRRLVEELLQIASGQITTFAARRDRIVLGELLTEVVDEMKPVMEKAGIRIEVVLPADVPTVQGDAEKIKEMFTNLLDNAVKYNKKDGAISVRVRVEGSAVAIEVADTGIGMSSSDVKNIFTPYFRSDAVRDIPGTGLGLYLVRTLATQMSATVTVDSILGQGTTFTVRFPSASVADA